MKVSAWCSIHRTCAQLPQGQYCGNHRSNIITAIREGTWL